MRSGKSILSGHKVPQFDGDLGPNISHKNASYDKRSYIATIARTGHFYFFLKGPIFHSIQLDLGNTKYAMITGRGGNNKYEVLIDA